jgi:UDP-N-acetylmuramyl pentapeptide synthase
MKQKKWSPLQIKKALSLSQKINHSITGISINSKTLKKNNLFLPLKGKNHDGHQFI